MNQREAIVEIRSIIAFYNSDPDESATSAFGRIEDVIKFTQRQKMQTEQVACMTRQTLRLIYQDQYRELWIDARPARQLSAPQIYRRTSRGWRFYEDGWFGGREFTKTELRELERARKRVINRVEGFEFGVVPETSHKIPEWLRLARPTDQHAGKPD